jgi:hypothetical protein
MLEYFKYAAICGILTQIAFSQSVQNIARVPENPLELASSGVHVVDSPEERDGLIRLMEKARSYYAFKDARQAYHVKSSFTVTSGGKTEYDGDWQLEEIYSPSLGVRLTARTAGSVFEQIKTSTSHYQDTPGGNFPLRLHEARGHLLGPLESNRNMHRDMIRTVSASLNGAQVTCLLFSDGRRSWDAGAPGRLWQEREECLDPQTGHLVLHSPAPGLYVLYDFSQSFKLAGQELPAKMTVVENETTVIEERVESLEALAKVDPDDLTPTAQMRSQRPASTMAGLQKISLGATRPSSGSVQTVVVFGLLTADGKVAEAHPLQSSDPALVEDAVRRVNQIKLQLPAAPGADREQHELFVLVHLTPDAP